MYHCYLHMWSSHDSPCPQCTSINTTVDGACPKCVGQTACSCPKTYVNANPLTSHPKIELDHPCKNVCSGWQQAYDRGQTEAIKSLVSALGKVLPKEEFAYFHDLINRAYFKHQYGKNQ